MRDELLAYLLNDLGPQERKRVEERLAQDPLWQHEFERLESCMGAYEANPKSACPPADLVHRTCSFVQDAVDPNGSTSPEVLAAPASLTESHNCTASRSRWSFADMATGAGVLLVMGLLLFPALRESRDTARQLKCQSNLQALGTALVQYVEQFGQGLPHVDLGENAGSFVVDLAESGILDREQLAALLVCPSSPLADDVFAGRLLVRIPTSQELNSASGASLARMRQWMSGSYAYRLGYRDAQGQYRQVKFTGRANAPMLADAPCFSVAGFQSPNHGGRGQNVVFQDLSSRYFQSCVSDNRADHLFLNDAQEHAAGRHARDVVLGRSEADPGGATYAKFSLRSGAR